MKIIECLVLGVIMLTSLSCGQKLDISYTVYDSDTITNIDLNPSLSNKEYEVSDILDSIKVLCLETNVESLLANVVDIILTEDRIFIRDMYEGGGVAIFDSEGNFIKRLRRGNGPGELPYNIDFAYDKVADELLVVSTSIIRFDKDGNYKGNIELGYQCTKILSCYKDGYILAKTYSSASAIPTFTNYSTLVTDRNFNLKQFLLPYSQSNQVVTYLNMASEYNGNTLISVPFCDTIYKFRNDSLSPYMTIDYSSEKRDMDEYVSLQDYTEKVLMACDDSKAVYLGDFFENATHFILSLRYANLLCSVFVDKRSGNYFSGYDCVTNIEEALSVSTPAGVHNGWFYELKNATSFHHNTITSNRYISKEDLAKLEQLKEDSNPFIMFYKLKDF